MRQIGHTNLINKVMYFRMLASESIDSNALPILLEPQTPTLERFEFILFGGFAHIR